MKEKRARKERPYVRSVKRLSELYHKPKIRVTVVLESGLRSKTFGFVSWHDADLVAEMFLESLKRRVSHES